MAEIDVTECPCPIPTPPGYAPCRLPRGHAGLHDFPTADSAQVADLQRRIERTVEYACEVVAATEDPNVLMVMDAVINSLRTPIVEGTPAYATVQRDQCNGRTLSCVNCGKALGERHDILCYAFAKAAKQARLTGGSTETADRELPSTAQAGERDA